MRPTTNRLLLVPLAAVTVGLGLRVMLPIEATATKGGDVTPTEQPSLLGSAAGDVRSGGGNLWARAVGRAELLGLPLLVLITNTPTLPPQSKQVVSVNVPPTGWGFREAELPVAILYRRVVSGEPLDGEIIPVTQLEGAIKALEQ